MNKTSKILKDLVYTNQYGTWVFYWTIVSIGPLQNTAIIKFISLHSGFLICILFLLSYGGILPFMHYLPRGMDHAHGVIQNMQAIKGFISCLQKFGGIIFLDSQNHIVKHFLQILHLLVLKMLICTRNICSS